MNEGINLPTTQPERYLTEAANGQLTSVPADKMDAWDEAQRSGELSPGLHKYKQQIKDRILDDLYGSKK